MTIVVVQEGRTLLTEETVTVITEGAQGLPGAAGETGGAGPQGDPGEGVPTGGTTAQVLRKTSNTDFATEWHTLAKADVGLSNVDNTSDASKPISSATQTALNAKAASSHTHAASEIVSGTMADARIAQSNVTQHQAALSLTASQVSDFSTTADARITAQKGATSGLATLDSGGKIPTTQLPALAITATFVVNSQAAQLALSAQEGDVAVRTDQNKSYIHNGGSAGTMGDWQELLTPTDTVLSVNGQTGAVSLTTSDVSEGSNLYFTAARAIASALSGFAAGAGTVSASDTILQAIQKIVGNLAALTINLATQVTGLLGLANGGTGASTARGACASLKTIHILAQSGVPASVTGTTSETALATIQIPANAMGANGAVRVWAAWSWTNNSNNKFPRLRFGGTGGTVYSNNTITTSATLQDVKTIQNRNATNSQVGTTTNLGGFVAGSPATVTSSVDTTGNVDIVLSGQCANAADTITLERYLVELIVS